MKKGEWFPPSYFFPKFSVFIFFHQQPVFPLMDHESHVNIQLSTKVCHILTKKSLSFSFSSFSFPFLSLKAWMWRCFFRTIQFYFSNRLSFTKISLLKSQAFFFFFGFDNSSSSFHFGNLSLLFRTPHCVVYFSVQNSVGSVPNSVLFFNPSTRHFDWLIDREMILTQERIIKIKLRFKKKFNDALTDGK